MAVWRSSRSKSLAVIRIFLRKKSRNWIRLVAALVLGVAVIAGVVHYYNIPWNQAITDSFVHIALAFGAMMVLENAFGFYFPKGSYGWFRPVLVLFLALIVLGLGNVFLRYLYENQGSYLLFLEKSLWVRVLVLLILFGSFSLLLIFHSELDDQLKLLQRKEQVERMAKDAELFQLRQQLQPHFLFNSLNSINALINRDPERAREMVLQLSEFLRGTIRKDDQKWIVVTEEISYLQLFLGIERIRFADRLHVVFHVGEEAAVLKIPPLLIQPLLENAVKHGLNSLAGQVTIETSVQKNGNYLEITISNPYEPDSDPVPGIGFGLEAVKRRLYLLFGRHDLLHAACSENTYIVWMKIPQLYGQDGNH